MKSILRSGRAALRSLKLKFENRFDHQYLDPQVPLSKECAHERWLGKLAELCNKPGYRVLEIGSREVTGKSRARSVFSDAEYVGFDIYLGENVDIEGDAHRLSSYFEQGEKFDLVFSSACFEHFAMPWIVAVEISKVLKLNGYIFVETHFSFSSHERPWNFFQYSDMGLRVLFPKALGFECVEAGMSNPMVGRFSALAAPYLRNKKIGGLYCHSEYLGKKTKEVEHFNWDQIALDEVVGGTHYPQPQDAP